MTEDQIERIVEAKIDALDMEFLTVSSHLGAADYDKRYRAIAAWADDQFSKLEAGK